MMDSNEYTPIVAACDNLNREEYINRFYVSSYEAVEQQKDAMQNNTIQFHCKPTMGQNCIDLTTLRIGARFHLQTAAGGQIPNNTLAAPIDYFPQTCIKSVEVYLGDVEVSNSGPYYFQRAMVDAWYNSTPGDRSGPLTADGLYPDDLDHLDAVNEDNEGLIKRRNIFGNVVGDDFVFNVNPRLFFIYLKTDIASVDKPLVSGVNMRVVIRFHENPFVLWTNVANPAYELKIEGCELRYMVRKVGDDNFLKMRSDLEHHPYKYRFKRIEGKTFSIPQGQTSLETSFVTQTTTNPERVLILMQEEFRTTPAYGVNPLIFKGHFPGEGGAVSSLASCNLLIDGVPLERSAANDQDDFARLHYVTQSENFNSRLHGNGMPWDRFCNALYLISYDLTKSHRAAASGEVRQPVKEGHLHLSLRFNNPLAQPLSVLVLQEYNASFSVDKNANVLYTYLD